MPLEAFPTYRISHSPPDLGFWCRVLVVLEGLGSVCGSLGSGNDTVSMGMPPTAKEPYCSRDSADS